MALPVKTGFPDVITVHDGYVIRFAALDPVTGAAVTGVNVTNASIFTDAEATTAPETLGPLMWVPGPGQ